MRIMSVELTNRCDMDCWFCPHSKLTRSIGDMSIDTVHTVIDKMRQMGQKFVVLNGLGESVLHPDFFEIVGLFYDAGIMGLINTNACALTQRTAGRLLDSPLETIDVSMDFAGQRENNLVDKMIHDPRVIVNIKGVDRNQVVAFRERWGNKVHIEYLVNFAGQMDFKGDARLEKKCLFMDKDFCVILHTGEVCACCCDADGVNILGHIEDVISLQHKEDGYDTCKKCNGYDPGRI